MSRTSTPTETATRYVGNCQICEGDQKLHAGGMVHHGYRRPGDGFIHGDCPGVGHVPYEVSCDLVKEHVLDLGRFILDRQDWLRRLRGGAVAELHVEEYRGGGRRELVKVVAGTAEADEYDLSHGCTLWERALRGAVHKAESDIQLAAADVVRCERRVAAWAPQPVRTVEEVVRKEEAARADREAAKDAARAAKAAKKAATAAKQAALAARRQAVVDGLVGALRALADQPASPERDAAAREVWADVVHSKKYPWLWIHELLKQGAEAPTLALGLTRRDPETGRVLY